MFDYYDDVNWDLDRDFNHDLDEPYIDDYRDFNHDLDYDWKRDNDEYVRNHDEPACPCGLTQPHSHPGDCHKPVVRTNP